MSSAISSIQPTDKMCCVPLETGVKYWGWISIVFNVLSVIANFVVLITFEPPPTDSETNVGGGGMVIISHTILEGRVVHGLLIGIALLSIGTSFMLVKAVDQRKRSLLLPYLISSGISLLFWFIVELPLLLPIVLILLPAVTVTYISYCVYSLFLRLRAEEQNQQNGQQYDETANVTSSQYGN